MKGETMSNTEKNPNKFCPYIKRQLKGVMVSNVIYCNNATDCIRCGWYPDESARRTKAIKEGVGIKDTTVIIDATELKGTERESGEHIYVKIKGCKGLSLSLIETYD